MLRQAMHQAWVARFGECQSAINVSAELEATRRRGETPYAPSCDLAVDFAKGFQVSGQAMQIRLTELGYIQTEPDNQTEFILS